ncbi:MAG: hypothetical protein ACFFCW_44515 [Candidatus Hodarchaeota archaeon]
MAKKEKKGAKSLKNGQLRGANIRVTSTANTKSVEKELSILEKLSDWHKRSDKTRWIIGEYLHS